MDGYSPSFTLGLAQGSLIIAGVGRFGQIINRLLVTSNISTLALDHQPGMI